MNYKDESLKKYLDDLAAKLPAPGGGSAAALSGALGASLLSMVINFTLGKPRYARYESGLRKMLDKTEKLRHEFLRLVDLDVEAYQSKDLKRALNVPFMVCRLAYEAVKICPDLVKKGNVFLASDVACGVDLLEAAFSSACFNVEINLKMLNDKKLSQNIRKELKSSGSVIRRIRLQTEERVGKIIRG